ncbi:hypothetical protein H704_00769 [Bartonella bacilliformis Peru38]|uniref:hypothetical protein n=1 Tax=Bartonella bacilliformis TaxID=774 RepID=UPI00044AF2C8|nr:hypothetical protein [Bartonella bacilliformis]EYS95205.1 hypothetical protein X470_00725 [Bartonella bacilliformis Peru-18]KEG17274.1 hypothetical protein H709_00617 [Bartonella bacilliformis CUSCO5]KEG20524.1 hypothetical protein H704_00769 [Bartonella bacilliformis Peru38]KEG22906.1 hypothetical protein H703_00755 [Bartonella bacilliformis Ver075]
MMNKIFDISKLFVFNFSAIIGAVSVKLGIGIQFISLLMTEKEFSNSAIGYSGTVSEIATIIAAIFVA